MCILFHCLASSICGPFFLSWCLDSIQLVSINRKKCNLTLKWAHLPMPHRPITWKQMVLKEWLTNLRQTDRQRCIWGHCENAHVSSKRGNHIQYIVCEPNVLTLALKCGRSFRGGGQGTKPPLLICQICHIIRATCVEPPQIRFLPPPQLKTWICPWKQI